MEANVVVIGAGIIGAAMAYHLTDIGVEGVVLVDKGDLDENDGSPHRCVEILSSDRGADLLRNHHCAASQDA